MSIMRNPLKVRQGTILEKPTATHSHDSPDSAPLPATDEKVAVVDPESTGADTSGVDPKKVLLKMDLHLIPMLALLYLLSFLDRGNIGNAKIEGLVETLHMTGPQYNWTRTASSGIHEPVMRLLIRYSDRVLSHLLRLRSSIQSHSQATETLDMVAFDYGGLGHGDDLDGHCTRLQRSFDCTPLPWHYRSRSISRGSVLHHHVVLPYGSPVSASHVFQCRQRRWCLLRPAGIRNRSKYCWPKPASSSEGLSLK